MFDELAARFLTQSPPLPAGLTLTLALAAAALTWSPMGYRLVRHVLTLIHEAGHAAMALLSGRRLSGIRLHSDSSGVTVSRGKPRGLGMVLTCLAGYPAPAVVGLAGVFALSQGFAAGFLWTLVGLSALMLLLVRNLYGLWVLLAFGVSLGVLSWLAPSQWLVWAAYLVSFVLLLGAPRAVVDLARARRRPGGEGSDADQLARLTHLPAALWVGLFYLSTVAALGYGGYLLLSPLR